jgi:hypothetical protein
MSRSVHQDHRSLQLSLSTRVPTRHGELILAGPDVLVPGSRLSSTRTGTPVSKEGGEHR